MAARLERAFGVSAIDILDLQNSFDSHIGRAGSAAASARAYVTPFLGIQANDIVSWFSTTILARTRLSVLLRILVNSTGQNLERVDFPGHDDAERPGWDGYIETFSGTPWIPSGASGWEFGVNADIKGKADGDFAKSVKAVKKVERENITFVFVTPRRWSGKAAWISAMKAKKLWKDVRAYDVSDLEQWMETSIAAQTWFANQTARPSSGVRTLEKCWSDWANIAEPPLHPSLFSTANDVWRSRIKSFLSKDNSEPLIITADSIEEAVAFLSQIFSEPELSEHKDRVLVFDEAGVLPQLAQSATNFIAVAHTRDVEREFGAYSGSLRTVVIYPRNAANANPTIVLEPLSYELFNKALEAMGKSRDEITRLANDSGRSLTVLRRRLSTIPAIRTPEWAANNQASSNLVPFVLLGTWDTRNEADQKALSLLAGDLSFDALERRVQELLQLNDSPVWSLGNYRGVISKIDSLFAIAGAFTQGDLNHFFDIAKTVLGEDDPALDLPEKDRWAAAVHGKKREFSSALREGISETLVLLAVHGKHLFGKRLGFDGEFAAANLVRELLEPLETRKLEANDRDLPLYAEAAPKEFLSILERDLRLETPCSLGLLRPVPTGLLGSPKRTGLLWALEGLAWNPSTFPRVVKILGRLSEVKIDDNWGNKPIVSLGSIFRAWMPQTAADHNARLKAIRMLLDKHQAVGWKICLQQFGDFGSRVGDYTHKPKWRPDGYGYGEPFSTWEPINIFVREMVQMALTMPLYTADMICDLIARLHALSVEDQESVWKIIDEWRKAGASDTDIARVRDKIRVTVLSRRARKKVGEGGQAILSKTAKAVYASMEPTDVVNKYEWLFRQGWVEESADELSDIELDFQARERRIEKLRSEALTEIIANNGLQGVFNLAMKGHSQRQIGWYLARGILNADQLEDLILQCLTNTEGSENARRSSIATGALGALDVEQHKALFLSLRNKLSEQEALIILISSPYRKATWTLVDLLSTEARSNYWRDVTPEYICNAADQNNESVWRLLDAKRPRAAFSAVHFKLDEVRPELLVEMLSEIQEQDSKDKEGEYQLHAYDIQQAFKLLNQNPDVPFEDKARLEFAYIDVLARSLRGGDGHQIPNLERYVEDHPEMFVQAIVWTYKRKTPSEDPPEFRIGEGHEHLAIRGYHLLEALEHLPGQNEATEDSFRKRLAEWVSIVRRLCSELDRAAIGDICLGKLLASASEGKDGVWPNEAVRDVMEDLESEEISRGAHTGLYNARGAHFRGEGGAQERELAAKYRRWAEALEFSHPFVSSSLLMTMVETYEYEAEKQDTEAGIRRRLRH
ncbi:addiction module antitoxin [Pseudomonas fluorescens]|uniref:Addiction module antitoxin n=2 Tax=Pseudomonas TaxID=286 RepID=A0A0N9WQQ0_PSEFL|nr:addiction module antitoxin [Pseudomonas fluorescens]